jgi:hypothetical protein
VSRNQIRRTNQVGGTQLARFLLAAGRAAGELKKLETARARQEDVLKSARLLSEKLRSPKYLTEQAAQMNLGLVSVSELEMYEAPVRKTWQATDLAKEEAR